MSKKRTSHKTRPKGFASRIPIHCHFDQVAPAADLKLWSEQPGNKNPQLHPAAQLDAYEDIVRGNGYRRSAIRSTLSGCITKGNGLVLMARRRGWDVPIENQHYASRAEEIRDVAADNELARRAQRDADALKQMLGELDPGDLKFTGVTAEEFERLLADANIPAGEFEITAKLHESHDYVLIATDNASDFVFLQTLCGVKPERSYKKTGIGIGRVVPFKRFLASLRENHHSIHVARGDDDHPPARARRANLRPAKPAPRLRKAPRR